MGTSSITYLHHAKAPVALVNQELVAQPVTVTMHQLAHRSGVSEWELQELVAYGVLTPVGEQPESWSFASDRVAPLRRADQLRRDLALDRHAFALTLMLLDQIAGLETGMQSLRNELRKVCANVPTPPDT